MRRVLFVCTGNLCRSPMAEYLLQDRLTRLGENNFLVESAGTIAMEGNRAASDAVETIACLGIDMSAHRARRLDGNMIAAADLIVVMERYHLNVVLSISPGAAEKTAMMASFLPDKKEIEIPDPYGGKKEGFIETLDLIKKATDAIAEDLKGGKSDDKVDDLKN